MCVYSENAEQERQTKTTAQADKKEQDRTTQEDTQDKETEHKQRDETRHTSDKKNSAHDD